MNMETARFCNECGASMQHMNVPPSPLPDRPSRLFSNKALVMLITAVTLLITGVVGVVLTIVIVAYEDSTVVSQESSSLVPALAQTQTHSQPAPQQQPINLSQFNASSVTIPYKELARNPDEHDGAQVRYTGEVIQVMETEQVTEYRINVTKDSYNIYDDTIYVFYARGENESRILEGDIVTFWGYSKGLVSYESTLGGTITIPQVEAVAIKIKQ
ncbi:hypothetical protein [Paenibacillus sp. 481]|uniref:hypothetical protein n=1 Tax=Paenibacillus sp. 481 TaxID=2835869 RepID=UPI001E31EEFA|nr:hypothetical protein [Paenibacillus sp. 481]UHA74491.1 hypothetical protein KIK04_05145 [Paenibacillus sp. 481]